MVDASSSSNSPCVEMPWHFMPQRDVCVLFVFLSQSEGVQREIQEHPDLDLPRTLALVMIQGGYQFLPGHAL